MFVLMGSLSVAPLRQVRLQNHRCAADLPRLRPPESSGPNALPSIPLGLTTIDEVTKASLIAALDACDGNRRRAAQRLKVSLRTVYNMIRRFGLAEHNPSDARRRRRDAP